MPPRAAPARCRPSSAARAPATGGDGGPRRSNRDRRGDPHSITRKVDGMSIRRRRRKVKQRCEGDRTDADQHRRQHRRRSQGRLEAEVRKRLREQIGDDPAGDRDPGAESDDRCRARRGRSFRRSRQRRPLRSGSPKANMVAYSRRRSSTETLAEVKATRRARPRVIEDDHLDRAGDRNRRYV